MLNELILQAVVNSAMNKYALTHGGRKGWCKEDIIDSVIAYGGDEKDYANARVIALKTMMESSGMQRKLLRLVLMRFRVCRF